MKVWFFCGEIVGESVVNVDRDVVFSRPCFAGFDGVKATAILFGLTTEEAGTGSAAWSLLASMPGRLKTVSLRSIPHPFAVRLRKDGAQTILLIRCGGLPWGWWRRLGGLG
jgi:hypothetical protein